MLELRDWAPSRELYLRQENEFQATERQATEHGSPREKYISLKEKLLEPENYGTNENRVFRLWSNHIAICDHVTKFARSLSFNINF